MMSIPARSAQATPSVTRVDITRDIPRTAPHVTSPPRDLASSQQNSSPHDQSKLVIDALSSLNDIKDIDVNEFDMYLPRDGHEQNCSSKS